MWCWVTDVTAPPTPILASSLLGASGAGEWCVEGLKGREWTDWTAPCRSGGLHFCLKVTEVVLKDVFGVLKPASRGLHQCLKMLLSCL